jgi:hypothetical protein
LAIYRVSLSDIEDGKELRDARLPKARDRGFCSFSRAQLHLQYDREELEDIGSLRNNEQPNLRLEHNGGAVRAVAVKIGVDTASGCFPPASTLDAV